jgi:hypothetical protein
MVTPSLQHAVRGAAAKLHELAWGINAYIAAMCGRIQSTAPLRYAIVAGMDMRDSRVHNYPPRLNAAPSLGLLIIRRNHKTGEAHSTRGGALLCKRFPPARGALVF